MAPVSTCAGVVLAAGTGRRMGRPKGLIEVGGAPLVLQAVRTLVDGGCEPVAVVVGAEGPAVAAVVADHAPTTTILDNADWSTGMASSVHAAISWAGHLDGPGALLVLPVDTPGIGPAVVRRVVSAWVDGGAPADLAHVATYDAQARNPVLLPTAVWPDLAARVRGDTGARAWLHANPDRVVAVDCTDLGDPTDLDTPEDLARWSSHREAAAAPRPQEKHMELTHTFTVPVPPEQAFTVLQDIEKIGPCMPGASIDSVDGTAFTGKVKVKIGPIQVTYAGEAEYAEVDAEAMTATINARGKESRGSGTANAVVKADLKAVEGGAEVHVVTDLAITGKPAQFGRGVMEEVGQKLINQFAECLASTLAEEEESSPPPVEDEGDTASSNGSSGGGTAAAASVTTAPTRAKPASAEPEAIDLLDIAGGSVAKRVGPLLGGVAVLYLLVRWLRRR